MSTMGIRKAGLSGAVLLLAIFLPLAFAQSGRQPQLSQQQPRPQQPQPPAPPKPMPKATETPDSRPRRANDEAPQDEPALRLSANLVTVITSVTDATGNQINNLSQNDFQVFEDNQQQEIAGIYREGQMPLRLIFLFDTS